MHASHRSWFPYILTGLSLALAAVLFVAYEPSGTSSTQSASYDAPVDGRALTAPDERTDAPDIAPSGTEYQAAVRGILSSYDATGDADAAWDTLIALWVPTEYKAVDVELVIAFAKLAAGDAEDGAMRLAAVRSANSWMSE